MKKKQKKTKLGIDTVQVLGHTFKVIETDKDEVIVLFLKLS